MNTRLESIKMELSPITWHIQEKFKERKTKLDEQAEITKKTRQNRNKSE